MQTFTSIDYEPALDIRNVAIHFVPGGGFGGRNPSKTFFGPDSTAQAKAWLEKAAASYE